jgi:hypothetical protein
MMSSVATDGRRSLVRVQGVSLGIRLPLLSIRLWCPEDRLWYPEDRLWCPEDRGILGDAWSPMVSVSVIGHLS